MSKIQFENGITVEVEGDPTQAQVEEIAKQLNIHTFTKPTVPKKTDGNLLDKAADFAFGATGKTVGSLFTSGIASAAGLYGQATGSKKALEFEQRLNKVAQPEKNITAGNIALGFLEQYPGGGFLVRTLKKLPGGTKIVETISKLPEALRGKAVKQYSEALGATTNEMKSLTAKVVPELLDRGIKTKNITTLSEKAITESDIAGRNIDEFIQTIPETTRMKVQPVIDALEKTKNEFIVDGVNLEPNVVKAADTLKGVIAKFGEDISPTSLRKVRQVWDKTIAKAGGFVGKTLKEGSEIDLKKVATSAIREELGKEFPDLVKLNAEYAFWQNVEKITEATLKRKSTQGKGLSRVLTSAIGGGAGFSQGQDTSEKIKNAVIGAAVGKYVGAFNSPGYKMLSATTKNKLAEIIASGDAKKIQYAMSKVFTLVNNLSKNTVDDE